MIIPVQACVFFLFSVLLIIAALMTVTARNPVRSALSLVLAFFCASVLWILLEAEFLGLVLVLVYVGAVMTLFLFVIMMLNIDASEKQRNFVSYLPYAAIITVVLLSVLIFALCKFFTSHTLIARVAEVSNTQALGRVLYTEYAYPFEIVGVLLLVAIIASIALSTKQKRFNKAVPAKEQLTIKSSDRVRIVKMEPNKKT